MRESGYQYTAIKHLFDEKQKFIILALTGRIGSGCSTFADMLTHSFDELEIKSPSLEGNITDNDREDSIVYNYLSNGNWKQFTKISASDVIFTFALEDKDEFKRIIKESFGTLYSKEVEIFIDAISIKKESSFYTIVKGNISQNEDGIKEAWNFFFELIPTYKRRFKTILRELPEKNIYTRLFQKMGNNLRASGNISDSNFSGSKYTCISERINYIIKLVERYNSLNDKENGKTAFVVIDSLKNPYEALYLRNRYSAFYLIALNIDEPTRFSRLNDVRGLKKEEITYCDLFENISEYKNNLSQYKTYDMNEVCAKNKNIPVVVRQIHKIHQDCPERRNFNEWIDKAAFYSQDVISCIQNADIHINSSDTENTFLPLKRKILKYIALIMHPGLVLPTSVERCMQTAFTAKANSGCLSRKVGAVVTDEYYHIKSLGWNDAPEGVTTCLYRNANYLLKGKDATAYSNYEKDDNNVITIQSELQKKYKNITDEVIEGVPCYYCFKDIHNQVVGGQKNQVHTRALHAEERAFLSIIRTEGSNVKNGYLFTTSSPCELCAKKAYDLQIQKIYYIEPYPGISESHVLGIGENAPVYELFTGAIGRAYNQLYTPVIPPKEEITLRMAEYHNKTNDEKGKNNKLNKKKLTLKVKKIRLSDHKTKKREGE